MMKVIKVNQQGTPVGVPASLEAIMVSPEETLKEYLDRILGKLGNPLSVRPTTLVFRADGSPVDSLIADGAHRVQVSTAGDWVLETINNN